MMKSEAREVLGVEPDADAAEIKRAYRQAALRHHPDKGGSTARMAEVNYAYEVLTDRAPAAFDSKFDAPFDADWWAAYDDRAKARSKARAAAKSARTKARNAARETDGRERRSCVKCRGRHLVEDMTRVRYSDRKQWVCPSCYFGEERV